ESNASGAHFFHSGLVLIAPCIRKCQPVEFVAKRLEHGLSFARNALAPIDQCAEDVKEQGARRRRARRGAHEPAGSIPFSFIAVMVFASVKLLISAFTASELAELAAMPAA